ncbi:MAG TPA: hypothetical protein VGO53_04575, partial [Steroidobacteraceae bacterium]|nr:hypothetical protein [Steroidobacteraceae bacterium]
AAGSFGLPTPPHISILFVPDRTGLATSSAARRLKASSEALNRRAAEEARPNQARSVSGTHKIEI